MNAAVREHQKAGQSAMDHPPAFIDMHGLLREWRTADHLPVDWTGIAKTSSGAYLLFDMEPDVPQRAVIALRSRSWVEAQREARLVVAMRLSTRAVLDATAVTFAHFAANQVAPDGLQRALKDAALTTVHDVTGHDPNRFWEVAIARLSPVFGLKAEDTYCSCAYLERKGLAQAFVLKAESLIAPASDPMEPCGSRL